MISGPHADCDQQPCIGWPGTAGVWCLVVSCRWVGRSVPTWLAKAHASGGARLALGDHRRCPARPGCGPHHPSSVAPHVGPRYRLDVSTCSVNATLPDPLVIDYSAANAALANFSKALSKEVGLEASASTRSGLDRSPPTSGSATTASPAPSPERVAATQTPRPGKWPVAPYLDDSPDQRSR